MGGGGQNLPQRQRTTSRQIEDGKTPPGGGKGKEAARPSTGRSVPSTAKSQNVAGVPRGIKKSVQTTSPGVQQPKSKPSSSYHVQCQNQNRASPPSHKMVGGGGGGRQGGPGGGKGSSGGGGKGGNGTSKSQWTPASNSRGSPTTNSSSSSSSSTPSTPSSGKGSSNNNNNNSSSSTNNNTISSSSNTNNGGVQHHKTKTVYLQDHDFKPRNVR